ncbi:carboxylate--amine ligase [Proteinivorax hydrogeniformans]|uniref:Carboxylate--amine ligase n=1 Tax=Proteinivorax hydrogeniformans TaxID=1826727 RepID=A0AAU8HQP1_9FIRM
MRRIKYKSKAVVLGCNGYTGLSVIRGLGDNGVYVIGSDHSPKEAYATKSKFCDETLTIPHFSENEAGVVDELITFAKKEEVIPVLIPCADPYAELVDKYLDRLKNHFLLPPINQGLMTKLMNKDSLHTMALKHDMKVPKKIEVTQENIYEKVEDEIGFPCLLKPEFSYRFVKVFNKKMFIVNSKEDLEKSLLKAKKEKLDVFVQQLIPGGDDCMHSFDAYIDKQGRLTHHTTCQKERQYPINFGASVYTRQRYFPQLYKLGAKFFQDIGYRGFGEIEFKKHQRTGEFYLIEVNVRITNFDAMLRKVGFNVPFTIYSDMINKPLPDKHITTSTNMYFRYLYRDIIAILEYLKAGQQSIWNIFKSVAFKKKTYPIWSFSDPLPFLKFGRDMLKRVTAKILTFEKEKANKSDRAKERVPFQ